MLHSKKKKSVMKTIHPMHFIIPTYPEDVRYPSDWLLIVETAFVEFFHWLRQNGPKPAFTPKP